MFRKLLIPALLGFAGVLMLAGEADAQRRGGGRSAWSGGGYRGGGYGGGGYGGNWYGNRGGYNSWNYFPGNYGNYGYRSGYYSGYRYPYTGYRYGYSTPYYYSNAYPSESYYYDPLPETQPVVDNSANIRVLLPDANAKVWFDGTLTQQTGTDRMFTTPPLDGSAANNYRVRATLLRNGQEVTEERVVAVAPGAQAVVDFR